MDTVGIPMNEGFGGAGLGAAAVGFILGGMMNGGWGNGWGGGGRAMQAGADVALANQMEHVSDQVQQSTISNLQSANGTQMQIANAAANVTQGINANTVAGMQGDNAIQQQICCATGRISQEIDTSGDQTVAAINAGNLQSLQNTQTVMNGLANLGQAITNQGYQNQLQTKDVLAAMAQHDGEISRQIYEQGCQNRELQREIQYQNTRDQLAQCQSERAALQAQLTNQAALQAQTSTIISAVISALKPTTTAAAGA